LENLGKMTTKAGTPCYISPEVLSGNYGIECDMWSCGCMLYILLVGYPPFEGEDDYELCCSILKGRLDSDGEEWTKISKEAKNLISTLICKPEKRLTAQEALEHKWVRRHVKKPEVKEIKGDVLKNMTNNIKNNDLA